MSNETKRVPVAPTEEMDRAGENAITEPLSRGLIWGGHLAAYKAMLEAALAPDDELARLEHILSGWFCDDTLENWQLRGVLTSSTKWFDVSEYPSGLRVKTLRWLEIQGRIERHPTDPNLVRLREKE